MISFWNNFRSGNSSLINVKLLPVLPIIIVITKYCQILKNLAVATYIFILRCVAWPGGLFPKNPKEKFLYLKCPLPATVAPKVGVENFTGLIIKSDIMWETVMQL